MSSRASRTPRFEQIFAGTESSLPGTKAGTYTLQPRKRNAECPRDITSQSTYIVESFCYDKCMMFKYIADVTMKRRSVMMNWKRKAWKRTVLPCTYFVKFQDYFKLFQKSGIDQQMARKLLVKNQFIFEIPLEELKEVFAICNKRQVDLTTLCKNAKLFTLPIGVMKNRIMLLEEMGVEHIHAALISSYSTGRSMRMSLFKAAVKIPESVDVAHKMIECLKPLPPNVPPLGPLSEDLSVKHFRGRCWEWYLNWRLNLSEADKELLDYAMHFMRSRSFRVMKKQIDILYDDIGLTAEQILRRPYLGNGCPDELKKTMEAVKTFGGIEIKKLIRVKPILYTVQCDNAIRVKNLLQKHGYTDKMKRLYPEILLLPHKELKKRIDTINDTPELRVLKNNKRSLMLVKSIRIVQIRLEYLRHHTGNHATVRALTSRTNAFKKLVRTGMDNTNAREIGMSFSKILNLEVEEIARRIRKHPFWRTVDIVSMHDVVAFLLERFSSQDIRDNILLILYSKGKIAETLKKLPEMNEPFEERKLPGKHILATCLYEIEREYHFSGDGIWLRERPPRPRRVFREQIDAELAESRDKEDLEPPQKETRARRAEDT